MENKVSILYIGQTPSVAAQLGSHGRIELIVRSNLQAAEIYLKTGQKPDAILCEKIISGGDGIEFHDKLRKDIAFTGVAFILIAHEFSEELMKRAFQKKIDDFFVLPFLPGKIDDLVGRIEFLHEYHQNYPVNPPEIEPLINFKMPWSKRVFDIVVASLALLLLSPLLLIVIIAIRVESKGKVYYTSKRIGRVVFDFYKLRSMKTGSDAELKKLAKVRNQYQKEQKSEEIDLSTPCPGCLQLPDGESCSPILYFGEQTICEDWYIYQWKEILKSKPVFNKIVNDPRVTWIGKIIRNTSIDELPQLINVIKGDMSIVGNRPLPLYEVERLLTNPSKDKLNILDQDLAIRVLAPAGITGLWQVELRGKGGNMSEEERMRCDNIYYYKHFIDGTYSFWYDIILIFRTVRALFQKSSV